jgi:hypothetical protein
MLAELLMLRLEFMLRTNTRLSGASDTRFVPVNLPANTTKPEPVKAGEARTGQ